MKESRKNMSLKEFNEARNTILFISDWGGLGDVLIHRLIFDDVKKIIPESKIHFCCLSQYEDAIKDHPLVDKIIFPENLQKEKYLVFYQTCVKTSNKYESHYGKDCKLNRAEVWGLFCGYEITEPNMHFDLQKGKVQMYKNRMLDMVKDKNRPIVVFSPKSAITTKCLQPNQIKSVVEELENCNIFVIEKKEDKELKKYNINTISNTTIDEWIHFTACADYVVTVDTATFHLAGGLGIPMTGIFAFANGKTYGKYYDFVLVQKHMDDGNWDCGPCYNYRNCPKTQKELKPCLTELTEKEIKYGINKMFEKWPTLIV